MERTIAAVHEARWTEWENLQVPTVAVFAGHSMFSPGARDELIRRRPMTKRVDLAGGSHDAHLDAFDDWVGVLREWLIRGDRVNGGGDAK